MDRAGRRRAKMMMALNNIKIKNLDSRAGYFLKQMLHVGRDSGFSPVEGAIKIRHQLHVVVVVVVFYMASLSPLTRTQHPKRLKENKLN